jgi:hypothetical protein
LQPAREQRRSSRQRERFAWGDVSTELVIDFEMNESEPDQPRDQPRLHGVRADDQHPDDRRRGRHARTSRRSWRSAKTAWFASEARYFSWLRSKAKTRSSRPNDLIAGAAASAHCSKQ